MMVQILVESPNNSDVPEWVIVELQGDLETKNNESISGTYIGDLHYTKTGVPILIIGHHILHGKAMDVGKPLVVLQKQHVVLDDGKNATKFVVQAVVKRKLLFKMRPKPIISYKES